MDLKDKDVLWSAHRFQALAAMSPADIARMQALGEAPVRHARQQTIRQQGAPARGFYLLTEGWVASSVFLPSGARLIQKIHLPGDILGTPSLVLEEAADTLTALTPCETSYVPEARIAALLNDQPRLSAIYMMAVQVERLTLIDLLATQGHSSATQKLAMFLLDLHARLLPLGLVVDNRFKLPLTQEIIGDVLGLSSVHVNRTFRALETERLIKRSSGGLRLMDLDGLAALAPMPERRLRYNPSWLPGERS